MVLGLTPRPLDRIPFRCLGRKRFELDPADVPLAKPSGDLFVHRPAIPDHDQAPSIVFPQMNQEPKQVIRSDSFPLQLKMFTDGSGGNQAQRAEGRQAAVCRRQSNDRRDTAPRPRSSDYWLAGIAAFVD